MLIFVYNADSGLFNTLTDMAHKIFSPESYECNLCAITYGNFGIKQEWKEFLPSLGMPMEFLHRNEFHEKYGLRDIPLPAVLLAQGENISVLLPAEEIDRCKEIGDLKSLLMKKIATR